MKDLNLKKRPIQYIYFFAFFLSSGLFYSLREYGLDFIHRILFSMALFLLLGPIYIIIYRKFGNPRVSKLSDNQLFVILIIIMTSVFLFFLAKVLFQKI